jgi:cell division protein ZapA
MNDEELIPINVWLAGRSYRLRIKPDEESVVRKSVKIADEKIADMRAFYAGKDEQDFMAMALLSYAADTAIESYNNPLLQAEINALGTRIDKALGIVEEPAEKPTEQ